MFKMRAAIAFFFILVLACIFHQSEATFKKPLFNGSIFGKRNNVDYDSAKALSALCEIASDTCQAWYQTLEKK